MERLGVQLISRVQATQRAGRAGRTAPGTCFRLYTARTFEREMADATAPEIQRVPLLGAVLHLKSLPAALGVDVLSFDFVDAPQRSALEEALRQLHLLDAIDAGAPPRPRRAVPGLRTKLLRARALCYDSQARHTCVCAELAPHNR
jgi:ATP-dependent RNA helicase DHX8/PRP22